MDHLELPKKLLRVEDLTFVLPDDFCGGLEEALQLLLSYIHEGMENSEKTDMTEEEKLLELLKSDSDKRVSLSYGIFEMDENGEYKLK